MTRKEYQFLQIRRVTLTLNQNFERDLFKFLPLIIKSVFNELTQEESLQLDDYIEREPYALRAISKFQDIKRKNGLKSLEEYEQYERSQVDMFADCENAEAYKNNSLSFLLKELQYFTKRKPEMEISKRQVITEVYARIDIQFKIDGSDSLDELHHFLDCEEELLNLIKEMPHDRLRTSEEGLKWWLRTNLKKIK